MNTTITRVHARAIWDSRGRPTVEAEVELAGGATGRASAPSAPSFSAISPARFSSRATRCPCVPSFA